MAVTLEHGDRDRLGGVVARHHGRGRARVKHSRRLPDVPGVTGSRSRPGHGFAARGVECFHPEVSVVFEVRDARKHHHVPLLLSPFGYSTYRGS